MELHDKAKLMRLWQPRDSVKTVTACAGSTIVFGQTADLCKGHLERADAHLTAWVAQVHWYSKVPLQVQQLLPIYILQHMFTVDAMTCV